MKAKNPKFNADGTIDLEIEHPDYRWIPFTASSADVEASGRDLYASAIAGEFGEIAPYVAPAPTLDQMIESTTAVQKHLDAAAFAKGYDNIVSACSYAGYENEFQAEGESFGVWRAAVWKYCYAELDKVIGGQRDPDDRTDPLRTPCPSLAVSTWRYRTERQISIRAPELVGISFSNEWILIHSGRMSIATGYAWDGCTPAWKIGAGIWLRLGRTARIAVDARSAGMPRWFMTHCASSGKRFQALPRRPLLRCSGACLWCLARPNGWSGLPGSR